MKTQIHVPNTRTQKQPAVGCCHNPKCAGPHGERFEFLTEQTPIVCPKCGADHAPMVNILVLIHFLYHDPAGGPITGSDNMDYRLACDDERAYLATVDNLEAATGDIKAANCPGCLAAAKKMGLATTQGWAYTAAK